MITIATRSATNIARAAASQQVVAIVLSRQVGWPAAYSPESTFLLSFVVSQLIGGKTGGLVKSRCLY